MMVDFDRVMRGIDHYLDQEILSKMGWQKWVIGTAADLYTRNAKEIYHTLKENELVKMLGIIKDDMIDLDMMHEELMKQARKGPVTIDLPLGMGKLTLNERDVDLLHQHITSA